MEYKEPRQRVLDELAAEAQKHELGYWATAFVVIYDACVLFPDLAGVGNGLRSYRGSNCVGPVQNAVLRGAESVPESGLPALRGAYVVSFAGLTGAREGATKSDREHLVGQGS